MKLNFDNLRKIKDIEEFNRKVGKWYSESSAKIGYIAVLIYLCMITGCVRGCVENSKHHPITYNGNF
jgi:hypothetical protein